jgi:hypothetical protein
MELDDLLGVDDLASGLDDDAFCNQEDLAALAFIPANRRFANDSRHLAVSHRNRC